MTASRYILAGVFWAVLLAVAPAGAVSEDEAQREIESLQRAIERDRGRHKELGGEAEALRRELDALRAETVAVARRVQKQEAAVTRAEQRLKQLARETTAAEAELARRRAQTESTLAALQRLAYRPPAALLASIGDPLDAARSAILLGAVIPPIRERAETLRLDLTRLAALRSETRTERAELARGLRDLERERTALARLGARKALLRDRAAAEREDVAARLDRMVREADDLRDLLARLEVERKEREERERAEAARRRAAANAARTQERTRRHAEAPREPAPMPLPPVVRGNLLLPAQGRIVRRYGEGEPPRSRGIIIATRQDAQVVAPHAGRVAYAGPFRGYGLLLIIEHGDGYHTLVTGFSRIEASAGQRVLAGEPIGRMGGVDGGGTELYVELRRNGQPVNPLPWLAAQKD